MTIPKVSGPLPGILGSLCKPNQFLARKIAAAAFVPESVLRFDQRRMLR